MARKDLIKKIGAGQPLFAVKTPMGFPVRTTVGYWKIITTIKHPSMKKKGAAVKRCLSIPDEVRLSKKDKMEKIRLYYDSKGNTLNVWFDDPHKEYICEETGEEVILVKDKRGRVIGFEKLNYLSASEKLPNDLKTLPVEVVVS